MAGSTLAVSSGAVLVMSHKGGAACCRSSNCMCYVCAMFCSWRAKFVHGYLDIYQRK